MIPEEHSTPKSSQSQDFRLRERSSSERLPAPVSINHRNTQDDYEPLLASTAVRENIGTALINSQGEDVYSARGIRGLLSSSYVFGCACFATLGGLVFGIDQGIVSIILVMPQFLKRFPEVSDSAAGSGFFKGLLTAMIELGALVGALNLGWMADRFSRKYSIVMAVVVFTIGSILQTAAMNYSTLVMARFIGGVGIGMLSMVAPLYISEISPPGVRGTLLVLEALSIVFGIVLAFWVTYATRYISSEWSWRLPFLLQMVPGWFLGIGILFLPFSPRWLVAQGREDEALQALAKLRQLDTRDKGVMQEWFDIRAEVQFHRRVNATRHPKLHGPGLSTAIKLEIANFADCFKRDYWPRTQVGIGLMFFQQFVGINALIYYSPSLFKTLGLDPNMQLIMSGVLNCTQLIGVLTSLYTMDRFGRRPLLLLGSVAMTISHVLIATLVGKYSHDWSRYATEAWMGVAFLLFYMLAFGASWGPVPWAMPSEIFPSSLRAKGVSLAVASNWLNNFIIGLITPPLVQYTPEGAYAFFAVFCAASFVWTYFLVPETSGKTLEQMDSVFGDTYGVAERKRREEIENEVLAGTHQSSEDYDSD